MQTLSFITSTFNEEKNLPDCLESVKSIANEMILVDGSSTDRTVEIAKSYGVVTVVTNNPPIFLINRQKAIDLATQEWILNLDADERLTPILKDEIVKILSDPLATKDINGFYIPRKNWFLGRYLMKGGVYPDYQLRLYRNGKAHFALKDVHEQAIVEGKTSYLKNPLEHLSDPYFKRYLMRYKRYTDRLADEYKEQKIDKNPLVFLKYVFALPIWWFCLLYFRHKGFMDSWQGFIFSFFSSLRFAIAYIKYILR